MNAVLWLVIKWVILCCFAIGGVDAIVSCGLVVPSVFCFSSTIGLELLIKFILDVVLLDQFTSSHLLSILRSVLLSAVYNMLHIISEQNICQVYMWLHTCK